MSVVANEIIRDLHACNLRVTPQRLKIMSYLKNENCHPTAEEIYKKISTEDAGISLATVYNTLNMLKDHNLVVELKYGDLASRYDGNTCQHYHVYCNGCGKVTDYWGPAINEVMNGAQVSTGYDIQGVRLDLYGICMDCKTQQ